MLILASRAHDLRLRLNLVHRSICRMFSSLTKLFISPLGVFFFHENQQVSGALSNLVSYITSHYSLAWFWPNFNIFSSGFWYNFWTEFRHIQKGSLRVFYHPPSIAQKLHTFTFGGHFQRDPPKGPPRLGKIQPQLTALQENGRTHWSGGRRRTQCCYQQWLNRGKPAARFWSLNFPRFSPHQHRRASFARVFVDRAREKKIFSEGT